MLTSSCLDGLDGIRHAFFSRQGGVSRGDFASLNCGNRTADQPGNIRENRRRAAAVLHLEADALVTVRQVHGNRVVPILQRPDPSVARPDADGMVTNRTGLLLGILTADCAPVLLADERRGVVGAAHAGWRGALRGIVEETVRAMTALGAESSTIRAAIGPCIAQSSYQVGADMRNQFVNAESGSCRYFLDDEEEERYRFDLRGYVAARLARAGVRRIDMLDHDTYREDSLFFSYRRSSHRNQAGFGLGLSAIALNG